jgi:hypothetical protein
MPLQPNSAAAALLLSGSLLRARGDTEKSNGVQKSNVGCMIHRFRFARSGFLARTPKASSAWWHASQTGNEPIAFVAGWPQTHFPRTGFSIRCAVWDGIKSAEAARLGLLVGLAGPIASFRLRRGASAVNLVSMAIT